VNDDRLKLRAASAVLDAVERRQARSERPAPPEPEIGRGDPASWTVWLRTKSGAPGDPPDERYWADEVRPAGVDAAGHLEWELVPEGLRDVVVHNTAETEAVTHLLAEDTIVRAEASLDRGEPPAVRYATHVPVARERLGHVVSYAGGTYTIQPVRRTESGFEDDGEPESGVPNLGELWDDEAGYLEGPGQFDRYVRLFWTPAGWTLLLHPPRMV